MISASTSAASPFNGLSRERHRPAAGSEARIPSDLAPSHASAFKLRPSTPVQGVSARANRSDTHCQQAQGCVRSQARPCQPPEADGHPGNDASAATCGLPLTSICMRLCAGAAVGVLAAALMSEAAPPAQAGIWLPTIGPTNEEFAAWQARPGSMAQHGNAGGQGSAGAPPVLVSQVEKSGGLVASSSNDYQLASVAVGEGWTESGDPVVTLTRKLRSGCGGRECLTILLRPSAWLEAAFLFGAVGTGLVARRRREVMENLQELISVADKQRRFSEEAVEKLQKELRQQEVTLAELLQGRDLDTQKNAVLEALRSKAVLREQVTGPSKVAAPGSRDASKFVGSLGMKETAEWQAPVGRIGVKLPPAPRKLGSASPDIAAQSMASAEQPPAAFEGADHSRQSLSGHALPEAAEFGKVNLHLKSQLQMVDNLLVDMRVPASAQEVTTQLKDSPGHLGNSEQVAAPQAMQQRRRIDRPAAEVGAKMEGTQGEMRKDATGAGVPVSVGRRGAARVINTVSEPRRVKSQQASRAARPAQMPPTTPRTTFVVPDTNCYLRHFRHVLLLKDLERVQTIVPLAVLEELDGLQQNADKSTAFAARKSVRYLAQQMAGGAGWLRGQQRTELRCLVQGRHNFMSDSHANDGSSSSSTDEGSCIRTWRREVIAQTRGLKQADDAIVECCLHFAAHGAVTLLTNDKALQVKAMIHQLKAVSLLEYLNATLPRPSHSYAASEAPPVPESSEQKQRKPSGQRVLTRRVMT
eukprot:SM000135S27016  [mRNA]  locus=s135:216360:220414:- [translate_table: standard]